MGFWSTLGKIGSVATSFIPGAGPLISAGISTATDLIGAHKAAGAANDAAKIQAAAAEKSNNLLDTAESGSASTIREGQKEGYDALYPYLSLGSNASGQLSDLMNDPTFNAGFQGKLNLPEFTPPNPQDVLNNPAIQFQLEQGQKAIERSAAAKGGLNSGATLMRVNQNAQGIAAQGYNDLFSRAQQTWQDQYTKALQDFNSAYGIFKDTRDTRLGLLDTALKSGQSASSQASNESVDAGNRIAWNALTVAGEKGANLQGGANATAAGKIAGANAWNSALTRIGQNVVDLHTLGTLGPGGTTSVTDSNGNYVNPGNGYTGQFTPEVPGMSWDQPGSYDPYLRNA